MDIGEHTYGYNVSQLVENDAWTGPAIGLLDLDAFFASVEQLDHPEWRGKPVIVGGPSSKRGVVSTASYEARRFGVHSAMASAQAERLCPQAIWTEGHFDRYREVSASVMRILADETPYVEQVSIDEAFFDISPGRFAKEDPVSVAERIMANVKKLGVTCSIGLGVNKTVAKIASERNKPRGLTAVRPGEEQVFLAPLPVSAMSGIGPAAAERLNKSHVFTLGQLSRADDMILKPIFGTNTQRMKKRAAGKEYSPVQAINAKEEAKSVSNERTFVHDLTDREDVDAALSLLGESVGRRLRRRNLIGNTVTVKLKFSYGSGRTIQTKLKHPTDDENIFVDAAKKLLDGIWSEGMHVRLLGLGMSDFDTSGGYQTEFFSTFDDRGAQVSDQRDLSVTIDKLRDRFGDASISFGRAKRFDDDIVRHPRK